MNTLLKLAAMKKEAILDEGVGPVIGGAAGAAGGYLAGKHLATPALKAQERKIRLALLNGEQILNKLKRLRKIAPITGGAIGALLLATLTARSAKQKERERMQQYGDSQAYRYDINPDDVQSFYS